MIKTSATAECDDFGELYNLRQYFDFYSYYHNTCSRLQAFMNCVVQRTYTDTALYCTGINRRARLWGACYNAV